MISLTGTRQLRARLKAVERAPSFQMRTLGLLAVRHQKLLVPKRTRNLSRTIHLASASASYALTVASASYAAAVEKGSKKHVIVPRKNRRAQLLGTSQPRLSGPAVKLKSRRAGSPSLRFKGKNGVVFAKKVNHPGTKAQPYMLPGAKRAVEELGLRPIIDAWNDAA